MLYITVPGTHGKSDIWWRDGSPLAKRIAKCGWVNVGAGNPFWNTKLDGWWKLRARRNWKKGGEVLGKRLASMRPNDRNVICHSHGLQVVLYASKITPIRSCISIAGPVRADVIKEIGTHDIKYWLAIHGDWSDRWQWFGTIGDGVLGIIRKHPLASRNLKVNADHNDVLDHPFEYAWPDWVYDVETNT